MRYYELRSSKKSHSDFQNPTVCDYFSAKDDADYDETLKRLTRGCEDWNVKEISERRYKEIITYGY